MATAAVAPAARKASRRLIRGALFAEFFMRIPTQGGQAFRFDRGHPSDLMPATIPI